VLRHRQDAEDVAQEAYARAYRRFRALRDRDRFRAWLVRMTWRLALDHRRAQGRRTARELTQVDPGTPQTATDLVAAHERASCLWAAIDALPERLRLVLVLAAIEEHDLAHVAQMLGLPVGTVKSRLFQARQQLKERLQWLATPRR
jgi:RNA polymerase sigma-70 factor, ECF subfamily